MKPLAFDDLVRQSRSVRRFDPSVPVTREQLVELTDLARLSPSGANRQPLKYLLSCDPETNALIFDHLAWAGYLTEWPGPAEGERPTAYIVLLHDPDLVSDPGVDPGIAAQTIMLGAAARGLGGCILGSIRRASLHETLGLPAPLQILLVLALGRPAEQVVLEEGRDAADIRYWRDEEGVHHVPKRPLSEIIVERS